MEKLADGLEEENFEVGRMVVAGFGANFDMVAAYVDFAGSTAEVEMVQSQVFVVVVDMEDRLRVGEKLDFHIVQVLEVHVGGTVHVDLAAA